MHTRAMRSRTPVMTSLNQLSTDAGENAPILKNNRADSPPSCCGRTFECCITIMSTVAVLLSIVALVAGAALSYPLHASCEIDWKFGESCSDVHSKILNQISTWKGNASCANGGEKCLYLLKSQTESKISATHQTPVHEYIDDLTFDFKDDGSNCAVHGFSTSEIWYAVLDYGTNYCNLNNLITGAALDKVTGYSESTSDSVCTQYSSHNCTVY